MGGAADAATQQDRHVEGDSAVSIFAADPVSFRFAPPEQRADLVLASQALTRNGFLLPHAAEELQCDLNFVKTIVRHYPEAFQVASKQMRDNTELALLAVTLKGSLLRYASAAVRGDKEVVTTAVRSCPDVYVLASRKLQCDREVAMLALSRNGMLLKYVSEALRDDVELVLAAVAQCPLALEFASLSARANREIALRACAWDPCPFVIELISETLLMDSTFLAEAGIRHFLLRLVMLSGRSCIVAVSGEATTPTSKAQVLRVCIAKLQLSFHSAVHLVAGGMPLPDDPVHCWPGIAVGKLYRLDVVVSSRE